MRSSVFSCRNKKCREINMDEVECLIRLPEVMRQCGLSKAAVYAYMKRGDFPQNMKLGARCSAWSLAEVKDWVRTRIARRGH